jgi:hypothetical protein
MKAIPILNFITSNMLLSENRRKNPEKIIVDP